ncbi:ABC transporter permease [Vagococcus xieshaowenii]|uniref:Putative hemin transport system permease protein HrtB n=2 Tax=Vagococcus xieshaowenii TaxID=2562451 RepID=A0AAJ5EFX5_9ENTE|nr:FtsX-like permease family protein [Vagococcus xieshaowenii]QCA28763.1 FtsX-like permease family protein [Vagococcus xieshaowenii]TFZ43036.1 FtsX-like permease family protein [Vagococcus xieshaowenii]
MFLALKEIKKEKGRFFMIVMVTILIAYLVYFLSGLAYGLAKSNTTSIDHWKNAEGIVLTKASNQNIYSSAIDEEVVKSLGLKNAKELNVGSTVVEVKNVSSDPLDLVLMGVKQNDKDLMAPITEGKKFAAQDEIVLSESFKELVDVKLGDTITLLDTDRAYKVVGFTESSKYNTQPVGYVDLEMASQAMMIYSPTEENQAEGVEATTGPTQNMPNRISALIVDEKVDKKKLADNDLIYMDKKEFINSIPGYQAQVLTFGLMIVSLILIASVIIGIFMYILTMQKKSIFAILKIQGISNKFISQSVIYQTLLISIFGALIGLALTVITFNFMPAAVPVAIYWPLYLAITGLFILCGLIGSIFSAKSVLNIDPLDAL